MLWSSSFNYCDIQSWYLDIILEKKTALKSSNVPQNSHKLIWLPHSHFNDQIKKASGMEGEMS